jgi:hypothetical protein
MVVDAGPTGDLQEPASCPIRVPQHIQPRKRLQEDLLHDILTVMYVPGMGQTDAPYGRTMSPEKGLGIEISLPIRRIRDRRAILRLGLVQPTSPFSL